MIPTNFYLTLSNKINPESLQLDPRLRGCWGQVSLLAHSASLQTSPKKLPLLR